MHLICFSHIAIVVEAKSSLQVVDKGRRFDFTHVCSYEFDDSALKPYDTLVKSR